MMTNIEKMNELVGTNATKKEIKNWAYQNRIHVVSLHLDAEEFSEMEKSVDAFYNSDSFSADEHANWEKFLDSEFVS
ncbi:hypothetical protein [Cytobacillus horneckiae]|uniref:hypothetical protein n=1 Tax=Cytobacillus horneckiae TaxID=549687 RepID=UPI003D9A3D1D